jgi:hypothetical protein
MSDVYFEGDPETDSARRRLERVMKGEPPPARWPWVLAALGSGGLWMMWKWGRAARGPETSRESRGGISSER